MTAYRLAPATFTLPLLIFAGLLGTSVLPVTNPHPRLAKSEIAVAEVIVGISVRSDELGFQSLHDLEGSSEVLRLSDNETLPGKKSWRAISDRAAEVVYRFEAEIAWHLGRVSSP
ncbi:MAG: hypothetical protein LAT56_15865 [Wenzhouxiangella sp.]|nr:hypothetical protein [Wenzhouxiangella sp.]